jgi:Kef-type K+ transport system membrane component KefB/mannitol/fructose-specific phosphotransferase system IIA component (Ntr-type)/nucleotide-binding universal stress UspA family protein
MNDISKLFTLPFQDPVLIFAFALIIFLIIPLVFERLHVPSIIGLLLIGAVVGPNGFGLLERDTTFILLGQVGLLYIMFVAGLEIDLAGFLRNRNRSLGFGAATFFLPQVLGTLMSVYFLGYGWLTSILIASMFASHTLLAYPIASRLGINRNDAVTTTVGGTIITDTAALLVLAVVAAASMGEIGPRFWLTLIPSVLIYGFVVLRGLPPLGRWFFRSVRGGGIAEFSFILAAVYLCAFLAELAGLEPIIGAFLAGLALNRLVPGTSPLMNRIEFLGNAIFIPFFLVATGMLVDFQLLISDRSAWLVAGSMAVAVTVTKYLAAIVTQRIFKYSHDEGMVIFGLSVPQAAATLAAAFVGIEIGLFDGAILNGTILMILVTCLIGPYVTQIYGRRVATADSLAIFKAGDAPQRIMIPLSNPQTAQGLMDVAFMLRSKSSGEAVFPISVVREAHDVQRRVAQAERLLGHTVVVAAEADVPSIPLTRVDKNPATALIRAATEQRISDIIIGWNGQKSAQQRIFGGIIDRVVEQAQQQVLVCKLEHAVNITRRVVVTLPPYIDYHPGFYKAIQTLKQLVEQLGVKVVVLAVQGDVNRIEQRFSDVEGKMDATFIGVTSWRALLQLLDQETTRDDIVMVFSARSGTVAYDAFLDRLPSELAGRGLSFIVLFPSRLMMADEPHTQVAPLANLRREHILFDQSVTSFKEAISRLLASKFAEDSNLHKSIAQLLSEDETSYTTEVLPGVLLPHAHVKGLTESTLLIGIFPHGIAHAKASEPVRLVAFLLSPLELSSQEHLTCLSDVAHWFSETTDNIDLARLNDETRAKNWLLAAATGGEPPLSLVTG